MHAMRRLVRVLVVLLSVAATASAQGPTAAPATPTPATPAAPATPTPATPAAPATPTAPAPVATSSSNITGVLAKGGQFNTFIRLLKSTGVASQIDNQVSNGGNGITVFAPTDNAFQSLPSGTLNSLSDQDKNALVQYHVVSTAIPMSQFDTVSNPLRTQAGSASPGEYPLNVTSEGQQVNITTGVVNATVGNTLSTTEPNLVVYQVDKVLLPMKLFGAAEAPALAPLAPAKKKGKTPAIADSPEAAEASPDATTTSLAPPRVTGGGLLAAALALAGVWWGLY